MTRKERKEVMRAHVAAHEQSGMSGQELLSRAWLGVARGNVPERHFHGNVPKFHFRLLPFLEPTPINGSEFPGVL